ncbi:phosphate ABC transporter ATP-binding protein PstB [Clostridium massiliamazoniense]|uniref:phosphate ABC transporter ATP-binding protein PstB n=1 Tax=Clostridium massiliamazoniense TaxID=1347366 RepID=UPI00241CF7EE|nr:phosphate ABC transporter ATP-binding protein PstB [Clostridium massiliamazoniense]
MLKMKIDNLELFYGNVQALKGISMNIEKNKVTALIGPSGCGKSTFLRCLNRMNDLIDSVKIKGSITYRDRDIYSYDVLELRKYIGMVFQRPNPFPMSIYDNIAFGLKIHGITNKKIIDEIVRESLIKVGLYEEVRCRLNSSALKLSGGQQQRLCIARAISISPDILLMDEPTSALDPIATKKIEELIVELKKDYTVVIVTHNMQQAKRISDYTAYFYEGEVVEFDESSVIFSSPKSEKTIKYIFGDRKLGRKVS